MPRSALSRLSAVSSAASRRTCRNNYIVWHYIKIVEPSTRCSTVSRRFSLPQPALSSTFSLSLTHTSAATIFLHNFHFIIAHNPKCYLFFQVLVEVFHAFPTHTHPARKRKTKDNKTENSKSYNSNSNNNGKQWNLWSFGEFYAFSALGRRIKCLHVDLKSPPPYLPLCSVAPFAKSFASVSQSPSFLLLLLCCAPCYFACTLPGQMFCFSAQFRLELQIFVYLQLKCKDLL